MREQVLCNVRVRGGIVRKSFALGDIQCDPYGSDVTFPPRACTFSSWCAQHKVRRVEVVQKVFDFIMDGVGFMEKRDVQICEELAAWRMVDAKVHIAWILWEDYPDFHTFLNKLTKFADRSNTADFEFIVTLSLRMYREEQSADNEKWWSPCWCCGIPRQYLQIHNRRDVAKHWKCSICRCAAYCSQQCQVKDWQRHKLECSSISEWSRFRNE